MPSADDGKMPSASDDMPDLDRPVTRRELREELAVTTSALRGELAVTTAELREELAALAAQFRAEFATKEEIATGFVEMREYVDFSWKSVRDELRVHFDLTAESFRSEFRQLYDWTAATTTSLATRIEAVEKRDASGPSRG